MSKSIKITSTVSAPSQDLVDVDVDCAKFVSGKELSDTPPIPAEALPRLWGRSSKSFTRYFHCLLYFFPILALLAGVACALTLLLDFDSGISHIQKDSLWFALTLAFWSSGIVLLLFAIFPFGRRVRQYRPAKADTGVTFCGFFTAAMLCLLSLRQLYTAFTTAPDTDAVVDILPLTKLAAVFLLMGAFYFLYVGLGKRDPQGNTLGMVLSLAACVAVIMVLFRDYFDFTLPLNSPLRHLATLAWSGLLLFLLSEARMQVDLWYTNVPFTIFACLFAVLFTGAYGLTGVIVALAGQSLQFDLIQSAMFLGVGALAFFRVRQLPDLIGDHLPPPPTKDEIKKYAKKHKIPYDTKNEKPTEAPQEDAR